MFTRFLDWISPIPDADAIAAKQLETFKRQLLEAQHKAEYYKGFVGIMEVGIARLELRKANDIKARHAIPLQRQQ